MAGKGERKTCQESVTRKHDKSIKGEREYNLCHYGLSK